MDFPTHTPPTWAAAQPSPDKGRSRQAGALNPSRHITSFILRQFFAACSSRSIGHTINGHRGTKRLTWVLLKLKSLF